MLLLGLDVETTGLDPEKDKIIEIGAAVWDTDRNMPVAMLSHLIRIDFEISAEITKLTGITTEDVQKRGVTLTRALTDLGFLATGCDCAVAHNAPFDKSFIKAAFNSLQYNCDVLTKLRYIDTMIDIPYPSHIKTRQLGHVAAEHLILNYHPHRALTDVLTMFSVLEKYDIEKVIERSKSSMLELVAQVSFEQKDLAKEAGFYWNAELRQWKKELKECDYDSFVDGLRFMITKKSMEV